MISWFKDLVETIILILEVVFMGPDDEDYFGEM